VAIERPVMDRDGFLFRVDAGPEFGLGHLRRSVALAAAVRERGTQCVVATPEAFGVAESVISEELRWEPLTAGADGWGGCGDLQCVFDLASYHSSHTVVVDSYQTHADYLQALCDRGLRVVAIDDLAREVLPAHVIINGGAHATSLPYRSSIADAVLLLGPEYALLRRELWVPSPRQVRPTVEDVLVTLGGSPPASCLQAVVQALGAVDADFAITIVQGPFSAPLSFSSPHPLHVVVDPSDLVARLAHADLAICGGGQTVYELAACGTPAIAIELADNQSASIAAVAAAGAVRIAGVWERDDISSTIATLATSLVADAATRRAMSAAGQRLVDGRGAPRVAAALVQAPRQVNIGATRA
jgi:spore coat polysaccharide biosynthesis predicted glycosyltransferase SpsG